METSRGEPGRKESTVIPRGTFRRRAKNFCHTKWLFKRTSERPMSTVLRMDNPSRILECTRIVFTLAKWTQRIVSSILQSGFCGTIIGGLQIAFLRHVRAWILDKSDRPQESFSAKQNAFHMSTGQNILKTAVGGIQDLLAEMIFASSFFAVAFQFENTRSISSRRFRLMNQSQMSISNTQRTHRNQYHAQKIKAPCIKQSNHAT